MRWDDAEDQVPDLYAEQAARCTCPLVDYGNGRVERVRAAFCPVNHDAMNVLDDGTIEMPRLRRPPA